MNPGLIAETSGAPVICTTYEDSNGLDEDIRYHFPGDVGRRAAYEVLGHRLPVELRHGQICFIRSWGLVQEDAAVLCRTSPHDGKIPEPSGLPGSMRGVRPGSSLGIPPGHRCPITLKWWRDFPSVVRVLNPHTGEIQNSDDAGHGIR